MAAPLALEVRRPQSKKCENSLPVKCRINCVEQSRVAEWLEQAFARTLLDQSLANQNICISRNEDDRNRKSPSYQFLLKIRSGHSRHGHVKEQASGLANAIRREELLG
jgi:hypothetical protein